MSVNNSIAVDPQVANSSLDVVFWTDISEKYYGLGTTEIDDIIKFGNEFITACHEILNDISNGDKFTTLVDIGNKIPSYCSLPLMDYIYRSEPNLINQMIVALNAYHDQLFEKDPSSSKTTDVYETIGCILAYSPGKAIRTFIPANMELIMKVLTKMKKRPAVVATVMARLSELFVTSKGNVEYARPIITIYNELIAFLSEKNNLIPEIPDAVGIGFKELKVMIKLFMEKGTKKESLKKINNLINKKSDIGQVFYNWILINPSTACKVIGMSEFDGSLIAKLLSQMRIQYALEIAVLCHNRIPEDKYKIITDNVNAAYALDNYDAFLNKISNITTKNGQSKYGLLLRYVMFMPIVYLKDDQNLFYGLNELQRKLISIANNLTALISEKSFSITISPMSRDNVFQEIVSSLNKADGVAATGFAAKLMDKDVVKKIKEGFASFLATDQVTGMSMICILESMITYLKSIDVNVIIPNQDQKTNILTEAYKLYVMKFNNVATKDFFFEFGSIFLGKVQGSGIVNQLDEDDIDEDIEIIQPKSDNN